MLSKLNQGRQKYGLKHFLKRRMGSTFNKIFFRVDKKMLINSLRMLGLKQGMIVMVHSSVSRIGFVQGGPGTIIDALCEIVSPRGCVMMPSFSMSGSMSDYIEGGEIFDIRNTPSHSGLLTETFRKRPGVIRSLHPTNSVLGWGEDVNELLQDHHKSRTPFGINTPFGRIAEKEDAYILLIDTYIRSFLHHVQERLDYPNLFMEGNREARMIDEDGELTNMTTRVLRPIVPYYIAIPSLKGDEPDWVYLGDYALLFPTKRDKEAKREGYSFEGCLRILLRRKQLIESGIFRMTKIGRAEFGLLHVKRFLHIIEPEIRHLLDRFSSYYDAQAIMGLGLPPPY